MIVPNENHIHGYVKTRLLCDNNSYPRNHSLLAFHLTYTKHNTQNCKFTCRLRWVGNSSFALRNVHELRHFNNKVLHRLDISGSRSQAMRNFWFHNPCFLPFATIVMKLKTAGWAVNNAIMRDIRVTVIIR
jgi:hypothetical protein